MAFQQIKLYQTGTIVAGNRLLDPDQRSVQARMGRSNSLTSGHRACQGCGEALGARYVLDAAMRATGDKLIAANATGCLEVFSTPFPESSWQLPWMHSLFGNAPAVATGIAAALRAKGREDIRVVGQGGDGGRVAEQRVDPGQLPGRLRKRGREDLEAAGRVGGDHAPLRGPHRSIEDVAGAERLAAALAGAVPGGERVRAVHTRLHRALLGAEQPIADRVGPDLVALDSLLRHLGSQP